MTCKWDKYATKSENSSSFMIKLLGMAFPIEKPAAKMHL